MNHREATSMHISLAGQVAIVTGAGRGLGRSFALELARRDAIVVVNDLPGGGAHSVVAEIEAEGGSAIAVACDISDPEAAERLVNKASGAGQLAALVNNAGIARPGLLVDLSLDRLHAVINIHLFGTLYMTRAALTHMQRNGYGRVVNIGSNASFGIAGDVNYSAAKAAMFGVTQTLALEFAGHGITVNTVLPAATTRISENDPIPGFFTDPTVRSAFDSIAHRLDPELSTPLVSYLCSPSCRVTGQHFSSVAGRYARVALGVAGGWTAPADRPVSAEDIEQHLGAIGDLGEPLLFPSSAVAEIAHVGRSIAAAPA